MPIPGYRYSGTDTFTIWKKFDTGTDNDTGIGERGKTECGVIPWVVLFFFTLNRFTQKVTEIGRKFLFQRLQDDEAVRNSVPSTDGPFSSMPVTAVFFDVLFG